ncbi:MAG: flagellar hook-length control protein FliK [Gammaproteobacteria bacterium]|jgi:hypothetical protein
MSEITPEMIQSVLQVMRSVTQGQAQLQAESQATTSAQLATQAATLAVLDKVAQGQQLPATVLNPNLDGQVLLRLAGEKVLVDTALTLKAGQQINVVVVEKTPESLQLKLVDPGITSNLAKDIQAQFLKISLPMQTPLKTLLTQLFEVLPKAINQGLQSPLMAGAGQQIDKLFEQLPNASQIKNPEAFRQTIQDSGIFMESRLLRGEPVSSDLKASLIRLLDNLKQQMDAPARQNPTVAGNITRTNAAVAAAQGQSPLSTAPGSPATNIQGQTTPAANPTATPVSQSNSSPSGSSPAGSPASASSPATPVAPPVLSGTPVSTGEIAKPANKAINSYSTVSGNIKTADTKTQQAAIFSDPTSNAGKLAGVKTANAAVSEVASVTQKATLTATQAAQKAIMLGRSTISQLTRALVPNLVENPTFRQALDLLPKSEFDLLLKQLLFQKAITAKHSEMLVNPALRNSPLRLLLGAVESGLARIQTQQLASVPQDDSSRQVWQMEIPFRDQKEFQSLLMRIQRDKDSNKPQASESTWTVSLNFNIGELGHMHSKVRLTRNVVSIHFWADEKPTLEKISRHMPMLELALQKLGLEVNHMTAAQGKPPDPVEMHRIQESLLDEQA